MPYSNGDAPDGDLDALLMTRGVVTLGTLKSGHWVRLPSLFRLAIGGTGTVTIDVGNGAGVITEAVATYAPTGEETLDFPFFGTDVTHLRATLTDTATCEVL